MGRGEILWGNCIAGVLRRKWRLLFWDRPRVGTQETHGIKRYVSISSFSRVAFCFAFPGNFDVPGSSGCLWYQPLLFAPSISFKPCLLESRILSLQDSNSETPQGAHSCKISYASLIRSLSNHKPSLFSLQLHGHLSVQGYHFVLYFLGETAKIIGPVAF